MDDNRHRPTSNVRISIPSFHCLIDELGKEYTVYKVNIAKPGGAKVIEKRYSEFFKLNKILKEKHELPRGRNIEFPPKRLNPSMFTKEERRKKLEKYMQMLNNQDLIPTEVLNFLGISLPQTSFIDQGQYFINHHQPIMGFLTDPFLAEQPGKPLMDILLDGVLDAFYEDVIPKS